MPTYQRGAGAHVAERVMVAEGSDEQAHYDRLVEDGGNWRRVDDEATKDSDDEAKRPAKTAGKASKAATSKASGGE